MLSMLKLLPRSSLIAVLLLGAFSPTARTEERRGIIANGGTLVFSCVYHTTAQTATVRWRIIPRPDRPPQRASWKIDLTPSLQQTFSAFPNGSHTFSHVPSKPGQARIQGGAVGVIQVGEVFYSYAYVIKVPFRTNCTAQ